MFTEEDAATIGKSTLVLLEIDQTSNVWSFLYDFYFLSYETGRTFAYI